MPTPTLLAQSQILAYRCVKMTTTPGFVAPATSSTDAILGVTTAAVTAANGAVTLQENENGLVLLTAGGTIAAGDYLVPTTNGSVISASSGLFVSTESAASGEILWAKQVSFSLGLKGIYGSPTASRFIKDVVSGADSLDIATIGDSNTWYDNFGYNDGIRCALGYAGASEYATPVSIMANGSAGNLRTFTDYCLYRFGGTGNSGGGAGQTGLITNLATAATAGDTNAQAIQSFLTGNNFSLLKPYSFGYDGLFVRSGTATSGGNGPCISVGAGTTFAIKDGTGSNPLQYRVVYGTFTSGSGQFKLQVVRGVNTVVARSTNPITTNTGTLGVNAGTAAAKLNFNSPEVSDRSVTFACNVDGYASGTVADYAVSPCAFFWHSLMFQSKKGYSVSNLTYYGGRTTAQLASDMSNNLNTLRFYVKELRERQIEAGGSGRVMIFLQSGINDGATSSSYTTSLDSIISTFQSAWNNWSFPASDLCFLIAATHPTLASMAGGDGWAVQKPLFVAAAKAWVLTKTNVTFVDFEEYRTAAQLNDSNLYSIYETGTPGSSPFAPYAAHLRAAPITAVETTWNQSVVASVTNPIPSGATGMQSTGTTSSNGYMVLANQLIQNLLK